MKTENLLDNPSSAPVRSPMLTDMLNQLATQVDNPILSSSPAVKEIRNKNKGKL